MHPLVFLRDDDVDKDSENFFLLREFLLKEEIPIVYGVIPYSLEKSLAIQLLHSKQQHDTLIDIVQHGYRHRNYHHDDCDKYEFGPKRTYQQQYQDIFDGKQLMDQYFGQYHVSAFVPPYHGFDQNTLQVLSELNFTCFSADRTSLKIPRGMLNFPVQVSLNDYAENGTPLCLSAKEMLLRVYRQLVQEKIIGLVFHHYVIQTKEQRQEMKTFLLGLARMRQQKKIQILLLSSIMKIYQDVQKGKI